MDQTIGFIGFGEVGRTFALGLREHGVNRILAYDRTFADLSFSQSASHAERLKGVTICRTVEQLVDSSDLVLSVVTSDTALDAARKALPHLTPRNTFIDFNSVSPDLKRTIGDTIALSGAKYVEAAIMAAVPSLGLRVPILVCGGAAARKAAEDLNTAGMNVEFFGEKIGRASAAKMFRSIIVKGLEALILECLLAASRYDVCDEVLDYVEAGYPGLGWRKTANFLVGRSVIHGARRSHEMVEVAATLRAIGIDPLMSIAASKRLREFADLNLKERLGSRASVSYDEVFELLNGEPVIAV
ncbi:NAD(P)-dependent oxidoreductase [Aquamicrobium sp. LC103]|uniref:NAD(P)-dependent oxidoreductase n=1 Tax=Aquamicrobium sp. LC103 TaxID=1120658 RepID=UPI00069C8C73|nr:NAD(P)-dependent oxidoreductase [Aquamicrobium sp. LC103]TKT82435.1 NAD(P)-dependent oxidoreductase [Aquamicrobium sp. LC103]